MQITGVSPLSDWTSGGSTMVITGTSIANDAVVFIGACDCFNHPSVFIFTRLCVIRHNELPSDAQHADDDQQAHLQHPCGHRSALSSVHKTRSHRPLSLLAPGTGYPVVVQTPTQKSTQSFTFSYKAPFITPGFIFPLNGALHIASNSSFQLDFEFRADHLQDRRVEARC